MKRLFSPIVILIITSSCALAQDVTQPTSTTAQATQDTVEAEAQVKEILNDTAKRLSNIKVSDPFTQKIIDELAEWIDDRINDTRILQDSVYLQALSLMDKMLDVADMTVAAGDMEAHNAFIEDMLIKTAELVKLSSDDYILDNQNLFRRFKTRLSDLSKALDTYITQTSSRRQYIARKNFKAVFEDSYDDLKFAKRFKLAVGASYTYLPEIYYRGFINPDTSYLVPIIDGLRDESLLAERESTFFESDLSTRGFPTIDFIAEIPYFAAEISIPQEDVTNTINVPVTFRNLPGDGEDILYRSAVTSTLSIEFDSHLRFSVRDALEKFRIFKYSEQLDFGFGIGLTGMEIEDKIVTDVRLAEIGQSFDDVESNGTIEETMRRSLNPVYGSVFVRLEAGDSLEVGFDMRFYNQDEEGFTSVEINGLTARITVSYAIF